MFRICFHNLNIHPIACLKEKIRGKKPNTNVKIPKVDGEVNIKIAIDV